MLPWKYSTKKVQFCKMQTIKIYFIITLVVQYSSAPTRVLKLFHDLQGLSLLRVVVVCV